MVARLNLCAKVEKLLPQCRVFFRILALDRRRGGVEERQYVLAFSYRKVVFAFREANAIFSKLSVTSADHENVIVRITDDLLNQLPRRAVRGGKHLHADRKVSQ